MRSLNIFISTVIQALKWPIGLVSLLLLPASFLIFAQSLLAILQAPKEHLWFLGGFGAYLAFWLITIRHWRVSWFSTLEHECTHALVALLSFCKVAGIKATWQKGGECKYLGKTHWLITLAPYFVPTLSLLVLAIAPFIPEEYALYTRAAMGVSISYHITSSIAETHRKQTDLIKTGFIYSTLFLPTANFLCYALLLQSFLNRPHWLKPLEQHFNWAWTYGQSLLN